MYAIRVPYVFHYLYNYKRILSLLLTPGVHKPELLTFFLVRRMKPKPRIFMQDFMSKKIQGVFNFVAPYLLTPAKKFQCFIATRIPKGIYVQKYNTRNQSSMQLNAHLCYVATVTDNRY